MSFFFSLKLRISTKNKDACIARHRHSKGQRGGNFFVCRRGNSDFFQEGGSFCAELLGKGGKIKGLL